MRIKLNSQMILIIFFVILVLTTAFFIYKYLQTSNELQDLKTNPSKLTALLKNENQKILDRLSGLMELPQENPQIIIISDLNSIASQPLLSKAAIGDAFVVYSSTKKAILYRPSQNKIIDVILISGPTPAPTISSTPSPTPQ